MALNVWLLRCVVSFLQQFLQQAANMTCFLKAGRFGRLFSTYCVKKKNKYKKKREREGKGPARRGKASILSGRLKKWWAASVGGVGKGKVDFWKVLGRLEGCFGFPGGDMVKSYAKSKLC